MIISFGLTNPFIDKLETSIEDLEKLIVACPIKNNIYDYSGKRTELRTHLDSIHSAFADSLREINKIS